MSKITPKTTLTVRIYLFCRTKLDTKIYIDAQGYGCNVRINA